MMKTIKVLRMLKGKTQFDLSLETRIPSYRLSLLENGHLQPSNDELTRLGEALRVSESDLDAIKEIERELEALRR